MSVNAREILNDFMNGVGKLSEMDNGFMQKFFAVDGGCGGDVLSSKVKELIGVAIGCYNRCQYCICVHTQPEKKSWPLLKWLSHSVVAPASHIVPLF